MEYQDEQHYRVPDEEFFDRLIEHHPDPIEMILQNQELTDEEKDFLVNSYLEAEEKKEKDKIKEENLRRLKAEANIREIEFRIRMEKIKHDQLVKKLREEEMEQRDREVRINQTEALKNLIKSKLPYVEKNQIEKLSDIIEEINRYVYEGNELISEDSIKFCRVIFASKKIDQIIEKATNIGLVLYVNSDNYEENGEDEYEY
jgi:hypothetical protein